MKATDFHIVYEEQLDKSEIELISKYWQFLEDGSLKFKNTLKSLLLTTEFKNTAQISKFVGENSFLTSSHLDFSCIHCKTVYKTINRDNFKKIISSNRICEDCETKEINNKAKIMLNKIEIYFQNNNFIHTNTFNYDISYLEKIYIFIIISEYDVSENGLIKKWDSLFLKSCSYEYNFIIR